VTLILYLGEYTKGAREILVCFQHLHCYLTTTAAHSLANRPSPQPPSTKSHLRSECESSSHLRCHHAHKENRPQSVRHRQPSSAPLITPNAQSSVHSLLSGRNDRLRSKFELIERARRRGAAVVGLVYLRLMLVLPRQTWMLWEGLVGVKRWERYVW